MEGGKYAPVRYARQKYGFDASQTLVAGDSGNDIPMFKGDENGVIVGNLAPEMLEWYNKLSSADEILGNKKVS
jgi:hydroxymethylpyrimidine pyrophosphatase-like HAD family hydrolase